MLGKSFERAGNASAWRVEEKERQVAVGVEAPHEKVERLPRRLERLHARVMQHGAKQMRRRLALCGIAGGRLGIRRADEMWRNGALQGATANEAFFVKCDRTTMTQDDIDNGRLICVIGIAPVKPAEFVIFRIQQKLIDQKQP